MPRYMITLVVFLLVFLPQTSFAAESRPIKTVALLPFDNLTGDDLSLDITRVLSIHLKEKEFKVISEDVLEDFFVRRRIRRTDSLSRTDVRELGETLAVDAIIIGSVSRLSGGDNPRVDLRAQMIDSLDSSILWINSVSCSGDDFASFLGIGRISSLQKLVKIAVKELFNEIPDLVEKKKKEQTGMVPFEIATAAFYPKAAKGGEPVGLVIEVSEVTGGATYVNAIISDKGVPLVSDGDRWYRGSFVSPDAEGIYTLKVYAAGRLNRIFFFDALASLVVDNTPPVVALTTRSTLISPNNDGINDYTLFFPSLLKTDTLKEWIFEIRDKAGTLIRSEDGRVLPKALIWRGENNSFKPVEDGVYFGQLIIKDKADHEAATDKAMITVDRTFPDIELVSGRIEDDIVTFDVASSDSSKIVEWDITIYDQDNEVMERLSGKDNLPSTIRCRLKKKVLLLDKKVFTCSLAVKDAAGNTLTLEKQSLELEIPEETEVKTGTNEQEKQWIEDF